MTSFKICLFNDLHLGSDYAITPRDHDITYAGTRIKPNEGQARLTDFFYENLEWIESLEPDLMLLGGDIIQGINYRESGLDSIPSDIDAQKDMAIAILRPFRKKFPDIPLYAVTSTSYHDSRDTKSDKSIVESLGGIYTNTVCNTRINKIEGKPILHLEHGSSQAFVYRGGMIDRKYMFRKVSEAEGTIPKSTINLSGHLHWFFTSAYADNSMYVISPTYQAQTPYAAGKQWERYQPVIGSIVIEVEDIETIIVRKRLMKEVPHIADKVWDTY